MGEQVQLKVISKIEDSRYLSLLVDETSDVSSKEWISYYFRIIDSSGKIQEIFPGLSVLGNTKAESLF